MLLFERNKSVKVKLLDENTMEVAAALEDNFHQIKTTLTIDRAARSILWAEAEMITVPFDMCREVCAKMPELVGVQLKKGISRCVEEIIGRSYGCVHLVDLVIDSVKATIQAADFCLLPAEMPLEEKMQKIQAVNMGICHTYSNLDRNPKYIGNRDV